jgi:hypothetical protein
VTTAAEELVASLLYEGYALYPYTPSATKNATPTPFGIVYPPAYAALGSHTFDHAQVQCLCRPDPGATLAASVHFLTPSGEGHEAREHSHRIDAAALGEQAEARFPEGRLTLTSAPVADGLWKVTVRVQNTLEAPPHPERGQALRAGLLSTHLLVRVDAGVFTSPLEAEGCESVNSWPVLAGEGDRAVLGACIALPDHPQIAPESRVNMFDNSEIDEALTLHVHVLSDAEREQISGGDPAVQAMIDRVLAVTPQEMIDMHGRMRLRDPDPEIAAARDELQQAAERAGGIELPPALVMDAASGNMGPRAWEDPLPAPVFGEPLATGMQAPAGEEETPGEREVHEQGVTFRLGETVILRPEEERDPYDRALHGRRATIERLYRDYDGRLYIGVTVDDVPEQQLLRETGRYLFFFAPEVQKP